MPQRLLLIALLIALVTGLLATAAAPAASHGESAGRGEAAARRATVPGGGTVELAASAKSAAEWAKQRPEFRELIPKTPK